jgi:integrase
MGVNTNHSEAEHPEKADTGRTKEKPAPWNRGKLIGQKPPLTLREVWSIRIRLELNEKERDLAMFNLAIDSKLRGCDLIALRVDDVMISGRIRPRAVVLQTKTGRPVQFEITEQTRYTVLQDKGCFDLRGAPQFASGPVIVGPYQAGGHGALSGDRG